MDPFEKVQLAIRVIINLQLLRVNQLQILLSKFFIAFGLRNFKHLGQILQEILDLCFL